MLKVCTRCNAEKAVSEFYVCKRDSRYDTKCKECKQQISRDTYSPEHRAAKWAGGERDTATKRLQSKYQTPRGRATSLILSAQRRAKEKGIPFALTTEWVSTRISAGKCEVTGVRFDMQPSVSGSRVGRAFSPSLDRIDSSLGYTQDNTQVVVWIYNRAKGVDGHDAVRKMAEALCQKS